MSSRLYQGSHSQGCHVCGGYPGNPNNPVNKLLKCKKCNFYTCDRHLKREALGKKCPNCGGNKLVPAMGMTSKSSIKSGGLPAKRGIAKAKGSGGSGSSGDTRYSNESAAGGGGASGAQKAPQESQNNVPEVEQKNMKERFKDLFSFTSDQNDIAEQARENMQTGAGVTLEMTQDQLETLLGGEQGIGEGVGAVDEAGGESGQRPQSTQVTRATVKSRLVDKNQEETLKSSSHASDQKGSVENDLIVDDNKGAVDLKTLVTGLEAYLEKLQDARDIDEVSYLLKHVTLDSFYRLMTPTAVSRYGKSLEQNNSGIITLAAADLGRADIVNEVEKISNQYRNVFYVTGVGPREVENAPDNYIEQLKARFLSENQQLLALGEVGLDLHYAPYTVAKQKKILAEQMALAQALGIPVYLTCAQAESEMAQFLDEYVAENEDLPQIVYTSILTTAGMELVQKHGFYVLVRPEITYEDRQDYQELIKQVPIERLLIGSGIEYYSPQKYIGEWNNPDYITETYDYLSKLLHVQKVHLYYHMATNFTQIFEFLKEKTFDHSIEESLLER